MALFAHAKPRHPISDFWSWWSKSGAESAELAIRRGTVPAWARVIEPRVAAIHPDLVWETSPGTSSQHRLTISANGVAALRPLAERWLRAAPAEGVMWEFRASREGSVEGASGHRLDIAGRQLQLDQARFEADSDEQAIRVHVTVFHPEFAAMPDDARITVAYLLLDWLIGEDDVERWVGEINTSHAASEAAVDAAGLSRIVSELATPYRLDRDHWAYFHGNDQNGDPYTGMIRRGVRWIDSPSMDLHQMVRMEYLSNAEGLPFAEELIRLEAAGDRLSAVAGQRVVLVGHIDNQGTRTFHYYSDSEDQNVTADLAKAARGLDASITSTFDPGWTHVRQMTG